MTSFSHSFPTEVWSRVFSFACTDDGTTGRSISSVCRYLRQASRRYRFQSVHLLGGSQISKFAQIIHQLDPEETKIRSLVVACPKLALLPISPNKITIASMYEQTGEIVASSLMDPYVRHLTAQRSASRDYEHAVIESLSQIIRACKESLESLSISLDFSLSISHYELPLLYSLVLYAPVSSSFFNLSTFPSLCQLRVGPDSMPNAEALFNTCPNIQQLHVHESTVMILSRLRRMLEIFSKLESVVVEMGDCAAGAGLYHEELAYIVREHIAKQLKNLAEEDSRVVLVKGGEKEVWMNALLSL